MKRFPTPALRLLTVLVAAPVIGGCVYEAPRPVQRVYVQPAPVPAYTAPAPQAVVSVYVEPPVAQPEPILVGWAPPPMLVEVPEPAPYGGAVWVGGYWVWEGNWVWAAGRWAAPPRPDYVWVHPYYEHRNDGVVFITGHWGAAGVAFVPPPLGLSLTVVAAAPGVIPGPRPIGPLGVFVPPPPGSRVGIIVPAPIGTPPAVVTSAAPVVNVGMRIENNSRTTTVNNTSNVTHITNVTNITNVRIVAPASATASGTAYEGVVPAQAHLAAALPATVHAQAPVPASPRPIPAFAPGRGPVALPAPQPVRVGATAQALPVNRPVAPVPAAPPAAMAAPAPVAPARGQEPHPTPPPLGSSPPAAQSVRPPAAVPAPPRGAPDPRKEAVAHERAAAQTPQAARPVVPPRPVEDPRARAAREQKAKASEKEAGKRRAEEADTKRAP